MAVILEDDFDEADEQYIFSGRPLTKQQAAFVLHYTSDPGAIGNAAESARRAGYSEKSARELGRQLLDKPHVRLAVDEANRQSISGRIATKAVALLEQVIDDTSAPIKVRVEAAKSILDRAGYTNAGPQDKSMQHAAGKPLAEMTRAELEEVVRSSAAVLEAFAQRKAERDLVVQ